jgi:predicted P-loop ATPase
MLALNLDRSEWRSFLDILGKDIKTVRLRSFFPKGHPLKATDHGKKSHADGEWIHRMQSEGRGVYIVVNDGGDTDSEIIACRAFFVEWDDRSQEEQINAWKELGLPQPTMQINTGGKSIHNYWVLKKTIDPKTWKPIQERLLDHADADRALKNPSRVMRLAGTYHMKDNGKQGGMTKIIYNSNKKYSYKDIEACLPTLKQHEKVKNSVSFDEFEKAPMDVVEKALFCIPPRKPNTNTYHMYRNILWGLIKACEDAGRSAADAVALMKNHSPDWGGIEQVAYSGGSQINAGSFWYFAKENGFIIPKVIKTFNPENPKEEVTITIDKMQKVDANELLAELESIPKESPNAFRYNVYTQQIQLGTGKKAKICEGKRSIERYYLELARQNKRVSKDVAFDVVVQVARQNEYNPVTDYLDHVSKNVAPAYIDRLATTYLRPEDAHLSEPTLYDEMLRKTLIAAVARAYDEGCKFDNACVIIGDQGARKSTFWSVLGGEFFSDALRDINGKDSLQVLANSWIMEWAELEAITNKKMAGDIKSFLSQSTDVYRVPYGKVAEKFKRRGIIVGTSNKTDGFLVDETGNRRFWCIKTSRSILDPIDCEGLLEERDAIWSAACALYDHGRGENLRLSKENQIVVNEENKEYIIDNPWKTVIQEFIERPQNYNRELTTEAVLTEAIEKPVERQNRYDQMQCANILKELGYEKRRRGGRAGRKWVYIRDLERV